MWFDSHCHLTSMKGDAAGIVATAGSRGVTGLLTIGCTVDDSRAAADVAARLPGVWATAGVHPHDAKDGLDGLDEVLERPEVVAVGECGLDHHYDHSPRAQQADSFARQIELAHERQLALVIHSRDAWDETFAILDRGGVPPRTVFHCFTGGPDEAAAAVERGAHVSFSGILTFPSAGDVQAAATAVPLARVLVETDSPYLAPVPHRGKANEPANVALVGSFLAELLDRPVAEVAAATTANARRVFGLGAPSSDDPALDAPTVGDPDHAG